MSTIQLRALGAGVKPAFLRTAALASALMLGACAQSGASLDGALPSLSSVTSPAANGATTSGDAQTQTAAANATVTGQSELEKATEYWGKRFKDKPSDLEAALSYAKNLKAMGERQQALSVLQHSAQVHGQNKELASEYGRLALELDQISLAKSMLAVADDPTRPDWRVLNARGTILAKEGKFAEAVPLFERALALSSSQTSVMNNLALAYAMGGDAARAEALLRKIEASGGTPHPKVRQNLALVVGLQGKFDESKQIASGEIGNDSASANSQLLRRLVKAPSGAGGSTDSNGGAPGTAVAGWRGKAAKKSGGEGEHLIIDEPQGAVAARPAAPASTDDGAPVLRGMAR